MTYLCDHPGSSLADFMTIKAGANEAAHEVTVSFTLTGCCTFIVRNNQLRKRDCKVLSGDFLLYCPSSSRGCENSLPGVGFMASIKNAAVIGKKTGNHTGTIYKPYAHHIHILYHLASAPEPLANRSRSNPAAA